MKRRLLVILLAALALAGLAAPALASVQRDPLPGKQYTVAERNGNQNCVFVFSSDGHAVQHGAPGAYVCTRFFFVKEGTSAGGLWKGEIETSGVGSLSLAAPGCGDVVTEPHHATSTTWIIFPSGGATYFVNSFCQRTTGGDCSPVLSANDTVNDNWITITRGAPGEFQNIHYFTPPILPLRSMAPSPFTAQQAEMFSRRHINCCPCA